MEEIYNDCKIQILKDGESFFLRYERGMIVSDIREIAFTEGEALKLMEMKSVEETFNFLFENWLERIAQDRHVKVEEYVGNTGKLY